MTTLTVEAGTFVDAVQRAARVCPVKGNAFDRAQGLIIEVLPGVGLRLLATDLESAFSQQVEAEVSDDSEAEFWRLPAFLLAGITNNYATGAGQTVKITKQKDGYIHFKHGRSHSKIRPILHDDYPFVLTDRYSTRGLAAVEHLSERFRRVAWAVATEAQRAPLTGVHIDGEFLYGCDGYKAAFVPCEVPVAKPITVPMAALGALVAESHDVKLGVKNDRLLLTLDKDTQTSTSIYEHPYPNLRAVVQKDFGGSCLLDPQEVAQGISSLLVVARNERYPKAYLRITKTELKVKLTLPEIGESELTFSVSDGPTEAFDAAVAPQSLIGALQVIEPGTETLFEFGPTSDKQFKVSDGTGYECTIMPVVDTK
jgi:DNA polymerase III sliding clamp (beta) subunit (PCNA family)